MKNEIEIQVDNKIKQAAIDGKEAFLQGKSGIPCLNGKLMNVIEGVTVEEEEHRASLHIMTAWSKAWTIESLKD